MLGGRYHLDEVLGVGGMSTVWRARDEVLGRNVAVKVLSGRYADDAPSRQRIRIEARAAAALAHPNVAQVHDFGETDEGGQRIPYVVMELVPGPTLEQRVATELLPPAVVFRVCAEIAAGLAAAHADGLVHRDVKPANVILAPTGAKVVDFGIAAAADPDVAARVGELDDELLGTADYLAPERLTDDAVTAASDVYSLGILLYKMLTGHLPWAVSGSTDLIDAHLHTPPAPLPPLRDVPARVAALCQRCMSKDPARRPTAQQVAAVLADAAGVRTVADDLAHTVAAQAVDGGPSTVLIRRAAAPADRRRRRRRVTVGVLAAAAAAILTWVLVPAPENLPVAEAQTNAGAGSLPAAGDVQGGTPAPSGRAPSTAAVATPTPGGGFGEGGGRGGGGGQGGAGGGQGGGGGGGAEGGAAGPAPGFPSDDAVPEALPTTESPAAPPPTAQTGAPATTEPPQSGPARTFTSAGGSVQARCTSTGLAELSSWRPVAPYKVRSVNAGPSTAATVAFVHGNRTVELTVTCDGTTPAATTTTRTK